MLLKKLFISGLCMLAGVSAFAYGHETEEVLEAGDVVFRKGEVIYEENFEDMSRLWIEGNTDNVRLEDGRLIMDSNFQGWERVLTVFVDNIFKGDLYYEYKAKVIASGVTGEPVNNINTFLYYSHPEGKGMRETKHERMDSRYPHYHELNGYIVTFLRSRREGRESEDEARIRLRENPGFILANEAYKHENSIGETYKIQFVFSGGKLYFFVDDIYMLSFEPSEEKLFGEGYFGFRTFATKLAVSDFRVRKLNQ